MDSSDNDTQDSTSDSNYSEEENEDDFYYLVAAGVGVVVEYYANYIAKKPCRTSPQTRLKFVMEILRGNSDRCQQQFRMEKHAFLDLCKELKEKYNLRSTKNMSVEELVAMFLITLGHGFGNRMVQELFQHSGETLSRHFNHVLLAVSRMAIDIINPIDKEFKDVPSKIRDDERYWPYFKDCIGAIDGTHVPVTISPSKQISYIGRKGIPTQNVMTACDFDMCFTFVWAGWEGTAHDTRIFLEAIRKEELRFLHPPRGKYYLVDAGYPNMKGYLGPYKGERYHLPDFCRGRQPTGMHEIFNHAHSSLRCTIERTFGVWKNRWKLLHQMPNFPYQKQVKIVVASMAIHNFIRNHALEDFKFKAYDDDGDLLPTESLENEEAQEELSTQQSETSNENVMNVEQRSYCYSPYDPLM